MTEQELPVEEYELEETEGEDQVEETETDEWQDDDQEEQPRKPNIIKKLREELKAAKKALREKEASENGDSIKLKPDQENDLRFFVIENPEAKDLKDLMKEALAKFPWISLDDALDYAKVKKPKESKTKTDFNFRSKSKPSSVMDLSDDEAAESLSPSEYLKYSRAKWTGFLKSQIKRI